MARRRYLITYDICDDRRLRRIAKVMEEFGDRLQYSVFLCDLNGRELISWRMRVTGIMKPKEDSIVVLDLGAPGTEKIEVIGASRRLPTSGPVVV